MTWIKTVPLSEASAELMRSLESQRPLYPKEYEAPVMPMDNEMAGIVASHSLIRARCCMPSRRLASSCPRTCRSAGDSTK